MPAKSKKSYKTKVSFRSQKKGSKSKSKSKSRGSRYA